MPRSPKSSEKATRPPPRIMFVSLSTKILMENRGLAPFSNGSAHVFPWPWSDQRWGRGRIAKNLASGHASGVPRGDRLFVV